MESIENSSGSIDQNRHLSVKPSVPNRLRQLLQRFQASLCRCHPTVKRDCMTVEICTVRKLRATLQIVPDRHVSDTDPVVVRILLCQKDFSRDQGISLNRSAEQQLPEIRIDPHTPLCKLRTYCIPDFRQHGLVYSQAHKQLLPLLYFCRFQDRTPVKELFLLFPFGNQKRRDAFIQMMPLQCLPESLRNKPGSKNHDCFCSDLFQQLFCCHV